MKEFIKIVLTNLLRMILTKKVAIWALKLAASQTKNKIDDNIIDLVEGGYDNNQHQVIVAAENIIKEIKSK